MRHKIKMCSEKYRYTVQAHDKRFAVCTKPFNARKTHLYFVSDLLTGMRGPSNWLYGLPFDEELDTPEGGAKLLAMFVSGEAIHSRRNSPIPLTVPEKKQLEALSGGVDDGPTYRDYSFKASYANPTGNRATITGIIPVRDGQVIGDMVREYITDNPRRKVAGKMDITTRLIGPALPSEYLDAMDHPHRCVWRGWVSTSDEECYGDVSKLAHIARHWDGRSFGLDYSPYSQMTSEVLSLFVRANFPSRLDVFGDRRHYSPIKEADLIAYLSKRSGCEK